MVKEIKVSAVVIGTTMMMRIGKIKMLTTTQLKILVQALVALGVEIET